MRALRLHGPRDARLGEEEEPVIRPGAVRIRVAWAGICGSDLGLYQAAPVPHAWKHPLVGEEGPHTLGHEFSGIVDEVAEDVGDVAPGDLVVVRPTIADGTCEQCLAGRPNLCDNLGFIGINGGGGGFSEAVVVPRSHVSVIPEGVGADVAALVEPLAVAWHAVDGAVEGTGSTALVVGAGPVGLSLVLVLRARGVGRIIVSEVSAARKDLARDLGADEIVDPSTEDVVARVRELTDGRGADVAFDASGIGKPTLQAAIDAVKPGRKAIAVATFHGDVPLDMTALTLKEKVVTGSIAYTPADFEAVIAAVADGRIRPEQLISSRISLEEVVERGLDHLLGDGRATEVKILVSPHSV